MINSSDRKVLVALLIASIVALIMVIYRIFHSSSIVNVFLVWNLFLAWIPYILSLLIKYLTYSNSITFLKKTFIFVFGLGWLLFFPNTYYLITDYIHINNYDFVRYEGYHLRFYYDFVMWFDFILFSIFAFVGFFLGVISLYNLQNIIGSHLNRLSSWIFIVVMAFLTGFGLYLGRFIRFNSWDIVLQPFRFLQDVISHLNSDALNFSLLFGVFILITYFIFYFLTFIGEK